MTETAASKSASRRWARRFTPARNYRRVVEIIQSGAIGAVKEVHVWVGDQVRRRRGSAHGRCRRFPKACTGTCGSGRRRNGLTTKPMCPFYWRGWWDFGGGALADMACHHIDLSFWALKLRHPTKVSAEGAGRIRNPRQNS